MVSDSIKNTNSSDILKVSSSRNRNSVPSFGKDVINKKVLKQNKNKKLEKDDSCILSEESSGIDTKRPLQKTMEAGVTKRVGKNLKNILEL